MKNYAILKENEINDQKKFHKTLVKCNTDNNKDKNIVTSFISKKSIVSKLKDEKEEFIKNKSNKNIIINNHQNIRMKKYLTNINDKLNSNINNKTNSNIRGRGSDLNRKSINSGGSNKNNNKIPKKQLYINEIIPNNNKILLINVRNSFLKVNNFNTYQKSPKTKNKNKEGNISLNSHSQKNQNHKKVINSNFNDKNIKYLRKNNTELNNSNTYNRSSSKSNKNIINLNKYKNKNNISSSPDKQKNYTSLVMRTSLKSSTYHRNTALPNKIINNDIYKKINMFELDYDLENNISEINYTISNLNSNDFALCNSNSSLEDIYNKLLTLCKEKNLTLAKIESNKFICKKDGDNSIKIEINKRGKTNVLKLYYLNGKEVITKEIIRDIILRIGF